MKSQTKFGTTSPECHRLRITRGISPSINLVILASGGFQDKVTLGSTDGETAFNDSAVGGVSIAIVMSPHFPAKSSSIIFKQPDVAVPGHKIDPLSLDGRGFDKTLEDRLLLSLPDFFRIITDEFIC
jgi:hypothetical protein